MGGAQRGVVDVCCSDDAQRSKKERKGKKSKSKAAPVAVEEPQQPTQDGGSEREGAGADLLELDMGAKKPEVSGCGWGVVNGLWSMYCFL